MTEAIPSIEDVVAAANSLFDLKGESEAANELRLSYDDIRSIRAGHLTAIADPTVLPRLQTWTIEHIDDLFELRNRPLPPFDHTKDFWSNFASGPRLESVVHGSEPQEPPRGHNELARTLFGRQVRFPFGVPSCALTVNSDWVRAFARAGFDVITYKTVRDRPWDAHEFPNWGIVADPVKLSGDGRENPVTATVDPASVEGSNVALANSFGVPSLPPEEWMPDVKRAAESLSEGQLLIVSVMGTPEVAEDDEAVARQFADAAAQAVTAGAHAIEANLSCPNTGGVPLSTSPSSSRIVLRIMRERLGPGVPLLAKIGYLPPDELRTLFAEIHDLLDGITAINTVAAPVIDRAGRQYFPGPSRANAGISGTPIHHLAHEVVSGLASLRGEVGREGDFAIIGVGGVTDTATFLNLLQAGADVVQSCSGAWADPNIASKIQHEMTTDSENHTASTWAAGAAFDTQLSLLAVLPPNTPLSMYDAAASSLLSPREVASAVSSAERSGWIAKSGDDVIITDMGRRVRRHARRTPAIRVESMTSGTHGEARSLDERFEAVYSRLEPSV